VIIAVKNIERADKKCIVQMLLNDSGLGEEEGPIKKAKKQQWDE
jgi:hypothetical protein